jgi:hypothetical protein
VKRFAEYIELYKSHCTLKGEKHEWS